MAILPESVQQIYNTETNEALSQLSNAIAAFHDYMQEPSSQDSDDQSQSEGVAEQQVIGLITSIITLIVVYIYVCISE